MHSLCITALNYPNETRRCRLNGSDSQQVDSNQAPAMPGNLHVQYLTSYSTVSTHALVRFGSREPRTFENRWPACLHCKTDWRQDLIERQSTHDAWCVSALLTAKSGALFMHVHSAVREYSSILLEIGSWYSWRNNYLIKRMLKFGKSIQLCFYDHSWFFTSLILCDRLVPLRDFFSDSPGDLTQRIINWKSFYELFRRDSARCEAAPLKDAQWVATKKVGYGYLQRNYAL